MKLLNEHTDTVVKRAGLGHNAQETAQNHNEEADFESTSRKRSGIDRAFNDAVGSACKTINGSSQNIRKRCAGNDATSSRCRDPRSDGKNDQQNKEDTEGADRVLLLFNFVSHVVPFKWANEPRLHEARGICIQVHIPMRRAPLLHPMESRFSAVTPDALNPDQSVSPYPTDSTSLSGTPT